MVKNKSSIYSLIFKTSFLNILLILLLVSFLIKAIDGFSNPQLLQREYYYFYPELFDEIPLEEEVVEELDSVVEHDQNHWQPVTDQEFGYMGDSEMETPYLMEELYLVQDDIQDLRVQQEIIKNDMGIETGNSAICTERTADDPDPCDGLSDEICMFNQYCNHRHINPAETVAREEQPGTVTISIQVDSEGEPIPDTTIQTPDVANLDSAREQTVTYDSLGLAHVCENKELDKSCNEIYLENGGVGRGNCPYTCRYKDLENGINVSGGLLL